MKLVRRILLTAVITLALVFVTVNWIAPVVLSFYSAREALPITKVVPTELKDHSISRATGQKLSYFGYEFEVPWSDLDENQIVLYPKDKPEKTRVDLHFRSGLRLVLSTAPPGVWARQLADEFKRSAAEIEAAFGSGTMKSDYNFVKALYEFTPARMNHWASIESGVSPDQMLLIIKSIALPKAAASGIFSVQGQGLRGFQQGDPQVRQDNLIVDLYSDEGSVELIFFQKDSGPGSARVTQPEINRIIQSFHAIPPASSTSSQAVRH